MPFSTSALTQTRKRAPNSSSLMGQDELSGCREKRVPIEGYPIAAEDATVLCLKIVDRESPSLHSRSGPGRMEHQAA